MTHYYLPLDLETTGLRPREDRILEVAWGLLNDDFTDRTAELRSAVVTPGTQTWTLLEGDLLIRNMHQESGLYEEMEAISNGADNGLTLEDIEEEILFDIGHYAEDEDQIVLLGSSVFFDKQFIETWMPRLHARLHYGVFDTSTMERFVEGLIERHEGIVNEAPHRAKADIAEDIALVRHYHYQLSAAQPAMQLFQSLSDAYEEIRPRILELSKAAHRIYGPPTLVDMLRKAGYDVNEIRVDDDAQH